MSTSHLTGANSAVYGIGAGLTECVAEIGARHPTNKLVLQCILNAQHTL